MYQHYVASSMLDEISARIAARQAMTGFLHDAPRGQRRSASASTAQRSRSPLLHAQQQQHENQQPRVLPPYINGGVSLTRGRTFTYNDPRMAPQLLLPGRSAAGSGGASVAPPMAAGASASAAAPPQRIHRQRSAMYREYKEKSMIRDHQQQQQQNGTESSNYNNLASAAGTDIHSRSSTSSTAAASQSPRVPLSGRGGGGRSNNAVSAAAPRLPPAVNANRASAGRRHRQKQEPVLIAKSSVLLDVKPWDDETDMKAMEDSCRTIVMDGLVWGASKLVPVGYGIKKLQIVCVVEDEKVSIDDLSEKIEEFEDYVQSVDIAAFSKI